MEPLHHLRSVILYTVLLLALISYTSYFKNWFLQKEALNNRLSTTPFFIAHVLNPEVDGYQFTSWTREDWLNWLERREKLHAKANKKSGRVPLPDKGINTVMIATPMQFLNAFEKRTHPYTPNPGSPQAERDSNGIFWGDTLFHTFVFHQSGNKNMLYVYKCPPMYVAAKLIENDTPVHLAAQAKEKDTNKKVKVGRDCIPIA